MKYDRPVWQLMHACADAMPETFRYDEVRRWFSQNYADVGEATIRAHVVGLSEGGTKHPQFERRSPLFRRVSRGVYAPIPFEERGELPVDGAGDGPDTRVRFTLRSAAPRASTAVGDELVRLEDEALARVEAERAMRVRSEMEQAERDRSELERVEHDREIDREEQERRQLEIEQQELRATLGSTVGSTSDDDQDPRQPEQAREPVTRSGGIMIVRAPRPRRASDADDDSSALGLELGDDDPRARDAIVLGSIGERLRVPAPAREAFRDLAFQRARRAAEVSGSRWFVLSAEHGLLEPQEWMSPNDRFLSDIEPRQRAAWAGWVVARLEALVGPLADKLVEIAAPDDVAAPVIDALREAGAEVLTTSADGSVAGVAAESAREAAQAGELPSATVLPFVRDASIREHLADPRQAVRATSAAVLPHHPGLYAWLVDDAGSRDLNRALRLPVRAGVIYVGEVGGSTGLSDSGFSLNDHITRVQLQGRARASTFRMTLAASLAGFLGLHTIEDPRLTQWMLTHLSVSVWPTGDLASLPALTASVVEELRPALNVDRTRSSEYHARIAELRGRLA